MVMLTNKKKYSTNRKTTMTKYTNNNSKKATKMRKRNNKHKSCFATPKNVHGNQGHPAHQNIDKY